MSVIETTKKIPIPDFYTREEIEKYQLDIPSDEEVESIIDEMIGCEHKELMSQLDPAGANGAQGSCFCTHCPPVMACVGSISACSTAQCAYCCPNGLNAYPTYRG